MSNVVGVPDTPLNVNGVVAPGTTMEMHPPLSTECPLLKALLLMLKLEDDDVAVVEKMLIIPPLPPEYVSVKLLPLPMLVVIPEYPPLTMEIAPPSDPVPA